MGQSASAVPEDRMKKRIRQTMGSFVDLGTHLKQANDWARLCPTPRTCRLSFRIVINERMSPEILPYVWKIRGNVFIEVRKLRRQPDFPTSLNAIMPMVMARSATARQHEETEQIGRAKILTVRQFYYVYCFLSDIKACAAHTIQPPEQRSVCGEDENPEFDDLECQICMDKQKQVVLPCTHSFCLYCFQHWTTQSKTCPICRSRLDCSEGDELWHLMSNDVEDIGSYATDLVARIYEFLEKRDVSTATEDDITRSAETYATASLVKCASVSNFVYSDLFPTSFPLSLPSLSREETPSHPVGDTEHVSDLMLALELASGEDQAAALKHYEQMRRDHVLAMTIAMQAEDEDDEL